MPAREFSSSEQPSHVPINRFITAPTDTISSRRRIRMQIMTDIEAPLDCDPEPKSAHRSARYNTRGPFQTLDLREGSTQDV